MGIWERKAAGRLADAIRSHLDKNKNLANEQSVKLEEIYKKTKSASTTTFTDAQKLHSIQVSVCAVCKSQELHKCNLPEGQSNHCALHHAK